MKALALNCTLKPAEQESNTEALVEVVLERLQELGAETEQLRVVDYDVAPGVTSDPVTIGDRWPEIRAKIVDADILILATPTWVGHPSSIAQRVLERMDAMISETKDDGRPIAYDKVAGVVVTGNEDGAHHCVSELSGGLNDIGFTVPAQGWTYWNKGPGPGDEEYGNSDDTAWSDTTARTAAQNLHALARALGTTPLPKPAA